MLAALLLLGSVRPVHAPQGEPAGPAPIDRAPRLRRTLSNGASVGAEARPDAGRVVLQAVLANPEGDRRAEYGLRHVLEHLVAARDPELDRKLETMGGTFGAATGRETMRFWVSVPPEGIGVGYEALRTLLKPIAPSAEEVARERAIVAREIATLPAEELAGTEVWKAIYGDAGLDPVGVEAAFEELTPAGLERVWRGMLVGPRLSLFVAGPVELDATVDRLERFARTFPDSAGPAVWTPRARTGAASEASSGEATSGAASSGAFGLAVGAVDERAALATALALASEVEGSSVTYTPSPREGVVLVSNVPAAEELRRTLRRGDVGLRNRALTLARMWIARGLDDPEGSSELRAILAAYRPGFVPERLMDALGAVREGELDAAFARWRELARR